MKNISNIVLAIIVIVGGYIIYKKIDKIDKSNTKSHYTITADTNVSKVKGLSKYVTQEEVDDFGFRYWDIDSNYTKNIKPNLLQLRAYLKQKNTNKIQEYIKDNNLSIDVKIQDGTTPLMYSSFYNDVKTSKYLIKNKANVHQKDKYGLSPLAYAIENNSTKTVKLLLDSGVKVEELKKVQFYLVMPSYMLIDKLIIDGDKIDIVFEDGVYKKAKYHSDGEWAFEYIVERNFLELAKLVLKSGYKPKFRNGGVCSSNLRGVSYDKNKNIFKSVYNCLGDYPNHKPMLELLLKYNVVGKPDKEVLQEAYDKCYSLYVSSILSNYDVRLKNKERIYYMKSADIYTNLFQKYCSNKEGSFSVRRFIEWANEYEKTREIGRILYRNTNPKITFVDKNQTELIIKPYKKLSSDEIRKIVYEN